MRRPELESITKRMHRAEFDEEERACFNYHLERINSRVCARGVRWNAYVGKSGRQQIKPSSSRLIVQINNRFDQNVTSQK
jgi:hypothetical protein